MTKLYLAIPCYNEEEVLWDSAEKLLNKYYDLMSEGKITDDSKIVFIDDGSRDKTWDIISDLHNQNAIFQGIKLSRNRGHQNALLCGLMTSFSVWLITAFLLTLIVALTDDTAVVSNRTIYIVCSIASFLPVIAAVIIYHFTDFMLDLRLSDTFFITFYAVLLVIQITILWINADESTVTRFILMFLMCAATAAVTVAVIRGYDVLELLIP